MRTLVFFWLALNLLGCLIWAQSQTGTAAKDEKDKKKQQDSQQKKEPQPLFGGKIPARSSQNTKESATLGFNGIDPSGKVEKKMLAANPGSQDAEKVRNLDAERPTPAQLVAFAKEGGLKTK